LRRSASARHFDEQGLAMSALGGYEPYVLLIVVGFLPNAV
jgi:hypothetical protein